MRSDSPAAPGETRLRSRLQYAGALVEAIWLAAARPGLVRAAPLFAGVLFVVGGMLRQTPMQAAVGEPAVLLAAVAGWLALTAYPRAAILGAPATEYLRSLPLSRGQTTVAVLVALLLIDAPWLALCVWTGDTVVAVAGPALVLGGHVAIAVRRLAPLSLAVASAVATAVLEHAAPSAVAFAVAVWWAPTAWQRLRARRTPLRLAPAEWRLPRVVELARGNLAAAPARDPWLVVRSALVAALATGLAVLVLRNNSFADVERALPVTLVIVILAAAVALAGLAAHVVEVQRALAWAYATTGTSARVAGQAAVLAMALAGAAFGALVALGIGGLRSLHGTLVVVGHASAATAALAVVLLGIAAWSVLDREIEPNRLVLGILGVVIVDSFVLGFAPTRGLGVVIAQAGVAALGVSRFVRRDGQSNARNH